MHATGSRYELADLVSSKMTISILMFGVVLAIVNTSAAQSQTMSSYGFLLIVSLCLLLISADFFVDGAKAMARKMGLSELIIGLTVVSIGTSLPEILVTGQSALAASISPEDREYLALAVGNIFGSVLIQITLILGIVIIVKPLDLEPGWLQRDGFMMVFALVLLTLLLWFDNTLSRLEGGLLASGYVAYITYLISLSRRQKGEQRETTVSENEEEADEEELQDWAGMSIMVCMILGLGAAVLASDRMVHSASFIAKNFGVSEAVIGTTIAAAGTSLPELAVGMAAAYRSSGVAIGTLLGSNITDPMFSIGIAALIYPITFSAETVGASNYVDIRYWIIPGALIATFMAIIFMWSSSKFKRYEGYILVSTYMIFLIGLITRVYAF
ncbi:MAG: hypothetical protein CMB77_00490 [Euryarchaeota archaeon]|nr:hypothetical protein [Euryarchaeota archaeon]